MCVLAFQNSIGDTKHTKCIFRHYIHCIDQCKCICVHVCICIKCAHAQNHIAVQCAIIWNIIGAWTKDVYIYLFIFCFFFKFEMILLLVAAVDSLSHSNMYGTCCPYVGIYINMLHDINILNTKSVTFMFAQNMLFWIDHD